MTQTSRLSNVLQAIVSVCILGTGLALFMFLGRVRPQPQVPVNDEAALVEVAVVEPHDREIEFSVDGVVTPFQDLAIAAEVAGRIVFKDENCRVGRTVRQGDVLLRIDPRDYEFEIRTLEEELEQAENTLVELDVQIESAQSQVALANEDLELQNRFLKRTETLATRGATTQSNLDTALRNVLAARTMVQTQQDQRRLYLASKLRLESVQDRIKSQLARAQVDLQRTEIRAPLDGVITQTDIEEQSYVQKGTQVFVVRDITQLDVRCSLQASQMYWLWDAQSAVVGSAGGNPVETNAYDFPETPVTVVYQLAGQEYAWDGVLARYDGADVDPSTRMIPCRVHVKNPLQARHLGDASRRIGGRPPTLMVGMFVDLRIRVTPRDRLLRIPAKALHPGRVVWLAQQGKLISRKIRIATTMGETVLVHEESDGLAAGAQVVISPLLSPVAGASVKTRGAP